jgi:hypothetical protein
MQLLQVIYSEPTRDTRAYIGNRIKTGNNSLSWEVMAFLEEGFDTTRADEPGAAVTVVANISGRGKAGRQC